MTAAHRRQRHAFDARSAAAQRVEAQWSARASLVAAVDENTRLEAQLAADLAQIEERGRASAAALTERTSERELADDDARRLAGAKDQLAYLGAALLANLLDPGLLTNNQQTLDFLSEIWPKLAGPRRHDRHGAVISQSLGRCCNSPVSDLAAWL